jgi:hypothetical protein
MGWLLQSSRAPGTTHACKSFFPQEVYISVGFKAGGALFYYALQLELPNLFSEEGSGFVDRSGIGQQLTQTRESRYSEGPQLIKFFFQRFRAWLAAKAEYAKLK